MRAVLGDAFRNAYKLRIAAAWRLAGGDRLPRGEGEGAPHGDYENMDISMLSVDTRCREASCRADEVRWRAVSRRALRVTHEETKAGV